MVDTVWLKDSLLRVVRVEELCKNIGQSPSHDEIQNVFKDEEGLPTAICRNEKDGSATGTLFNIVMDLEKNRATVTLGRPIDPEEQFELSF